MPIISKKSCFILFSLWLALPGALLSGQDMADTLWHMKNTHPDGISDIYLHLKPDGTAVLLYYQNGTGDEPAIYHSKEEEWYYLNRNRIILQDYMGEFILLEIAGERNSLRIASPVAYFSGSFLPFGREEWDALTEKAEATDGNL